MPSSLSAPTESASRTFALTLASAALLRAGRPLLLLDPCQKCPACIQVKAGSHPDVLPGGPPRGQARAADQAIRTLCLDLSSSRPAVDGKLAIVDDADDMNEEAANAFLKTLEELPDRSVLILIGTSAELQLETIISRCRVVRFDPLPEDELAALLLEQNIATDPGEATRLAKLGEGSVAAPEGWPTLELDHFRRGMIDELGLPSRLRSPASAARFAAFIKEAKESVDH